MNTMTGGHRPAKRLDSKQLLRILLGTAAVLLVPLLAMQFTREVDWTTFDFVVAAVLLAGTGLLFQVAANRIRTRKARMATCALIALGFVFVWACASDKEHRPAHSTQARHDARIMPIP